MIAEVKALAVKSDGHFSDLVMIVNDTFILAERIYDMYEAEKKRADELQAQLDRETWKNGSSS